MVRRAKCDRIQLPETVSLGHLFRPHWSVDNQRHHVLDVTSQEDHCQVRDRTTAHNPTLVWEFATKFLKAPRPMLPE